MVAIKQRQKCPYICIKGGTFREREKKREIERERDRKIERQRDREIEREREKDRKRDRKRERKRERNRYRQKEKEIEREREKERERQKESEIEREEEEEREFWDIIHWLSIIHSKEFMGYPLSIVKIIQRLPFIHNKDYTWVTHYPQ